MFTKLVLMYVISNRVAKYDIGKQFFVSTLITTVAFIMILIRMTVIEE